MRRKFILLMLVTMSLAATAQTTGEAEHGKRVIEESHRLHSDREYKSALTLIETVNASTLDESTKQEYELLRALITFENDHHRGRRLITQYLSDYPNSSQKEVLNSYLACSSYFDGDYEGACALFEKSDISRLSKNERERATLYHALAMLESGQEGNAVDMLRKLKLESRQYSAEATFHLAIIDYNNGKLDNAQQALLSIQMERKYNLDIPYYLAGIELKRGNNSLARSMAERFIATHGEKPQGKKMLQILGAVEFADNNYSAAVKAFDEYFACATEPQRIALYQMGLSLFQEGEYESATKYLDRCTTLDDEITQSALLHKGIIQLNLNDTKGARLAFELASQMKHNDTLREEALYNYAMCLHSSSKSAFGEGVRTFETFLNEYPNSKHTKAISEHLVDVYMNSSNYNIALESINKIKNPSADILKAKQNIFYRMGIQEFLNGNNHSAIDYMNSSLELAKYDKQTEAGALFWKGEALYKTGKYSDALKNYRKSAAIGGENQAKAIYGTGYVLFQEQEYNKAQTEFERFIKLSQNESNSIVADAYSRIGDCHYYRREFETAKKYYEKATSVDIKNADYSLFRSAITMGMSKDYASKTRILKQLIAQFPNGSYTEQAYYELGRTYIEQNKYKEAVVAYDNLAKRFPSSPLARRAATEKAMIYNNNNDYANAIEAYKAIIEQYPHSEEAKIALQDLKNIYIEQGKVNDYVSYVSQTQGLQHIDSNAKDTLSYTTAERFYSKRELDKAKAQFKEYLNEFPQGAFKLNSHYYLGLIHKHDNEPAEALRNFEAVIEYPDNKFSEEANIAAGELYYENKEYDKAIAAYKRVSGSTIQEERRLTAQMNILRAAQKIDNHKEVIASAEGLIGKNGIDAKWEREALFARAKAHIALNNIDSAVDDLDILAEDTRTTEGAESKYMIAEIMFGQKMYDECEEEIFDYIETSTPHAYWLARSFILLADLYTEQGKAMEAKQYLVSLQNNYNEEDDIAGMITERLSRLENDKE